MAYLRLCLLAVLNFATRSLQAKAPINDFCRRWGHQTAEVDGKLYVDGGLVAWNPLSTNPLNYTNTWLLYSDLNSSTQDVGMPYQYANLTKNSTVPSVSGGVLWADEVNKCFYLFGGQFQSSPSDFGFWAYDTLLNQWNETEYTSNVNALHRVAFGAGTQVQELGFGYYYGGWMNNLTSPGWNGPPMAMNNLIRYDYTTGTLNNNSGPADGVGRAEGQMVYLPASDGGLLIYFGGVEDPNHNGSVIAANMSRIHIYDISSSKWYVQNASGNVPPARRQFCAGATWADDYSSYNIYLYGGFGVENVTGYDDAYILSLPSFTWIKAWPTDNETQPYPHGGCSANVINKDQMIIIGGWFTTSDQCDSQNSQGQHNMNLGYNGPSNTLWDKYDPNVSKYFVPTPVISMIGGGPTGGATATKPATWDSPDLGVYFDRVPTFAARAATRALPSSTTSPPITSSSKKTNVGAIAGGVVGGLVGLIVVLSLLLFCLHRRKKAMKNGEEKRKTPSPPPTELPATSPIQEVASPGTTKFLTMQADHPDGLHPAYSGENSSHTHSPSNDYHARSSPYSSEQYHSTSPTASPPFPSPYNSEFPHPPFQYQNGYAQHPDNANIYDTRNYDPNSNLQRQYSYPISHSSAQQYTPVQAQLYYPPPPDPAMRARSHPSHLDHSQEGTQNASENENSFSPPSTTTTPAQFYAQPVPIRVQLGSEEGASFTLGEYRHEGGSPGGSISTSTDSRKRPVRGRFVEVDHM